MYSYIRAVILNDVLVKYPTVMAFDVNVIAVTVTVAVAAVVFVLCPYTVQMKIHFRTVASPSNVYLGHDHLLTVAVAAVTNFVRPVSYQIIQMIYHG